MVIYQVKVTLKIAESMPQNFKGRDFTIVYIHHFKIIQNQGR